MTKQLTQLGKRIADAVREAQDSQRETGDFWSSRVLRLWRRVKAGETKLRRRNRRKPLTRTRSQ